VNISDHCLIHTRFWTNQRKYQAKSHGSDSSKHTSYTCSPASSCIRNPIKRYGPFISRDRWLIRIWQMEITSCLHVCSPTCTTHFQPSFQSLLQAAQDALENLFSPLEARLRNGHDMSPIYPTCDQLFFSRIIGLIFYKLYVSNALLPKEKVQQVSLPAMLSVPIYLLPHFVFRRQHFLSVNANLARARREFMESTQSGLVWNYLPVDIAQRSALKLDLAMTTCKTTSP
jgi:hypothetical protein